MAQASLKTFTPDLPPSGRWVRQRTLVKGDPSTSRITEVRLGARPDRRDWEPTRCAAKRKNGDQCGRFPAAGRVVCIVHGAGSARRQREGTAMPPEVSGAIGSAIRDVRRGRRRVADLAAFFPDLAERLEAYRQNSELIELRDDAANLAALGNVLLSGKVAVSVADVLKLVPRLALAKARVLLAHDTITRKTAVPIDEVNRLLQHVLDVLYRNVPPDRHEMVARELQFIGSRPTSAADTR